ncbi:MAG: MBL fold metallo-hydrolase, partial [Gemmatimonadales bacterium]
RYDAVLAQLGLRPVGVIDTHAHADHLSGGPRAAEAWRVPYYLHAADGVSPFDGAAARVRHEPLADGQAIAVGRAALRVAHNPGHTLGSATLMSDDGVALTGDFVFIKSLGRPDLGGQADAWGRLLWQSLERARREWPGDVLVLPAHYASETERRADRAVAARFDVIRATNDALRIVDADAFERWLIQNPTAAPPTYRTIKVTNLGLAQLADADADTLESGPNQCAVK